MKRTLYIIPAIVTALVFTALTANSQPEETPGRKNIERPKAEQMKNQKLGTRLLDILEKTNPDLAIKAKAKLYDGENPRTVIQSIVKELKQNDNPANKRILGFLEKNKPQGEKGFRNRRDSDERPAFDSNQTGPRGDRPRQFRNRTDFDERPAFDSNQTGPRGDRPRQFRNRTDFDERPAFDSNQTGPRGDRPRQFRNRTDFDERPAFMEKRGTQKERKINTRRQPPRAGQMPFFVGQFVKQHPELLDEVKAEVANGLTRQEAMKHVLNRLRESDNPEDKKMMEVLKEARANQTKDKDPVGKSAENTEINKK
jgi:hypothetical protein